MKTIKRHGRGGGFTLVELLVVIAIIAMLMGLLFPAISTVKNSANKARAGATIQQLCTATRAYNNEYGKWPEPNSAQELVYIYNGLRDPITGQLQSTSTIKDQNPRSIQFMEFKAKDVSARSASSSSGEASYSRISFYDPWGTPYGWCFDNGKSGRYCRGPTTSGETGWRDITGYDNVIDEPFNTGTSSSKINGGFAFFSGGPDTRSGTGLSNPSGGTTSKAIAHEDDVRSWK